jgi:hypothetical protein
MDQYYDIKQLAEFLHKKKDTVRKLVARGDFGETLNTGKQHLVSESHLKAYIVAHTGQAHSERTYDIRGKRSSRVADCMARI